MGCRLRGWARVCDLIVEVDPRQSWMTDGARSLTDWVAARLRVRNETASQLVRVARRLEDLPVLSERFASGDLSLDQVDAISRMATADTETGLIEEALGLSNAVLDRKARRANPPVGSDEREAHRVRALWIQHTLDGASGRPTAHLPHLELEIVETAIRDRADQFPVNPETGLFDAYFSADGGWVGAAAPAPDDYQDLAHCLLVLTHGQRGKDCNDCHDPGKGLEDQCSLVETE